MYNRSRMCLPSLLAVLMALATATSARAQLPGSSWQLDNFQDGKVLAKPLKTITLSFDKNGRVGGSSGCNSYGGTYTAKGGSLVFGPLQSTLRACAEEEANKQEAKFQSALQKVNKLELKKDKLTVWYNRDSALNFTKR